MASVKDIPTIPGELFAKFQTGFYADPVDAVFKALGVGSRVAHCFDRAEGVGAELLDGMPRPILLRLGRGSTFTDLTYLTRQANTFACHSWRSYFPSPLPVTLMYSELIAALLGKLATVPFWNPSLMYGTIGETRWFL